MCVVLHWFSLPVSQNLSWHINNLRSSIMFHNGFGASHNVWPLDIQLCCAQHLRLGNDSHASMCVMGPGCGGLLWNSTSYVQHESLTGVQPSKALMLHISSLYMVSQYGHWQTKHKSTTVSQDCVFNP